MINQNFSVLIIDQHELNSWLLAEQIKQWLTDIVSVNTFTDAWQQLNARHYHLIFLDEKLPTLNGRTLIENIRNCENPNQSAPVIAIALEDYKSNLQTLYATGFSDYLCKPMLLDDVLGMLHCWIFDCFQGTTADYAQLIAMKTKGFSSELREKLILAVFTEAPQKLTDIKTAIDQTDWEQAWLITHNLHGSLGFFGFNNFLPTLNRLAQSLKSRNSIAARVNLQLLSNGFSSLQDHRLAILQSIV